MSVTVQTGNSVAIQTGNRVIITAPGPQGPPGSGGGGTPGGTNTQVQFNDSGSFGGDAGLTYNKTTDTLSATNLTVSGLSTLAHIHGSIAGNLYVHIKNTSGVTIAKGTPVYATGSVGTSGEIEVAAADYTNSAKMPSIGITDAQLIANAEGNAVVVGEITGLATNSYAINQELFVGTAGLLGALPATGEAQSIAVVSRVHASTGIIVVNAQARLNAALRALANNVGSGLTALNASNITSGSLADAYIASAATWNAKQNAGSYITALTGDVTASGPGSVAATLANTAVTPGSYTSANITVDAKGRVTAAANGSAGDVVGPSSSTDNTIARFDGTTGKLIQGSDIIITDLSDIFNVQAIFGQQPSGGGGGGQIYIKGGEPNSGNFGGSGGVLNLKGGDSDGLGAGLDAGNINVSDGGGSINTRGTGSIELGANGTRTTLTGTATGNQAIALPDASGTVALTSDITGTNSGTNTGDVTLAGTPDYITISGQVITRNAIDLAADVTGILPIANIATGTPDGTKFVRDDGTLAVPASGGASDLLSDLTASEISVTGAATATISRMHVCSGTSVDYTVTLPAASGNAGKLIGVRMAIGLTRLVTIDANGTELIDGSQTRIMWAGESAILLCNGTGWSKIAGKSIPMVAESRRNTAVSVSTSTATFISLNNNQEESVSGMIGSGYITARRPGTYSISALISYQVNGSYIGFESYCAVVLNTTTWPSFTALARLTVVPTSFNSPTTFSHPSVGSSINLQAGDFLALIALQHTGVTMSTRTAVLGVTPYLRIVESPNW